MTVIAMTREMGSLGGEVAQGLARELGLKLVYHEIVESLAQKMRLPASAVTRFVQGRASLLERWSTDLDRLTRFTAEEILELALSGNVLIRGWGATCLLRPVPHVLCVRVCAPFERRVQRLADRLGLADPALAAAEIRRSDAAHGTSIRSQFGLDWRDPSHYDLVLNTERVSVAQCIAQIRRLAEAADFSPDPVSRGRLKRLAASASVRASLGA